MGIVAVHGWTAAGWMDDCKWVGCCVAVAVAVVRWRLGAAVADQTVVVVVVERIAVVARRIGDGCCARSLHWIVAIAGRDSSRIGQWPGRRQAVTRRWGWKWDCWIVRLSGLEMV